MGPGHAVHDISGVMCWFCVSRLCTFFCVERSLPGLHSDICDQWCVNVFELPEVLFVNQEDIQECTRYHCHHPQEELEINSLKSAVKCQSRILNTGYVNKLSVVLKTSLPRQIVWLGAICLHDTKETPWRNEGWWSVTLRTVL